MTTNPTLQQLYLLLEKAETLAKQFTGGYSNHFFSAEEFSSALTESITKLKVGEHDQINTLWMWFAPAGDWDDFIHQVGEGLANEIFALLSDLRKDADLKNIIDVIKDYQHSVERVMDAFKQAFNRTDLLKACRSDNIYPAVGELKKYGIKRYAFHGIGLAVDFNDKTSVDFDFAFLPGQRHDGFDLWRLGKFVSSRQDKYGKYDAHKMLESDFNKLIECGIIAKPKMGFSTTLYFFASALSGSN
ncbi:MAG: hypothetical protein QM802_22915 [Agriterribacter sp.]